MTDGTVIHEGMRYRVTSYGNGLAYMVERKADGWSLFMQDENAATFREIWDEAEATNPSVSFNDVFELNGYDEALEPPWIKQAGP